ncbi:MAG: hypothetical protein HY791_35040 [Deltaproteobacteria bacterium]|nr:hypothetical protein [Deltaproteobacteria bacterium]
MRIFAALFGLLAACSTREIDRAQLDTSGALWFALDLDPATSRRLSILTAAPIELPLVTNELAGQLGLIGVPLPLFDAIRPPVDPDFARRATLLETQDQECLEGELDWNGRTVRYPLVTAGARAFLFRDGALVPVEPSSLVAGLSVAVPAGSQPCVDLPAPRPFGARAELIPEAAAVCGRDWSRSGEEGNFSALRATKSLDANRWLVRSNRVLFDARRGEELVDAPGRRLCQIDVQTQLGLRDWQFRAMALDPLQPDLIYAAGLHLEGGALVVIRALPEALELVRVATVTPSALLSLEIHESGTMVAAGRAGLVLTATSPPGRLYRSYAGPFELVSAHVTADPRRRFVFGANGENVVVAADPIERPQMSSFAVGSNPDRPVRGVGSVMTEEGAELWAVSAGNTNLLRFGPLDTKWEEVRVATPPVSPGCAPATECGRSTLLPGARAVLTRDPVVFGLAECGLLIGHDTARSCAWALDLELALGSIVGETNGLDAVSTGLSVAGERGLLLELPW